MTTAKKLLTEDEARKLFRDAADAADATTEKTTRPAPPPLEARCPDCSICGEETDWEDGEFHCQGCRASWGENSCYDEPGEWFEPDAEQCPWAVRPFDNHQKFPNLHGYVYRCILNEDDHHEDDHQKDGSRGVWHYGLRVDKDAPGDTFSWPSDRAGQFQVPDAGDGGEDDTPKAPPVVDVHLPEPVGGVS